MICCILCSTLSLCDEYHVSIQLQENSPWGWSPRTWDAWGRSRCRNYSQYPPETSKINTKTKLCTPLEKYINLWRQNDFALLWTNLFIRGIWSPRMQEVHSTILNRLFFWSGSSIITISSQNIGLIMVLTMRSISLVHSVMHSSDIIKNHSNSDFTHTINSIRRSIGYSLHQP